jgi:hypothetical protein
MNYNEAPGDEETPPDLPEDDAGGAPETTEGPPVEDTGPPDLGGDDLGDQDFGGDESSGDEELVEPEISEKLSTVMNATLYQRFLTLHNTIDNQLTSLKGSNDVIYAVSPKALEAIEPLSKLGENIGLYLSHNFLDSNYSKNLLFYNKCLNLLNMLNAIFSRELKRGKSEGE